LKEEALAHNLWRTEFGRSYGPALRQTILLLLLLLFLTYAVSKQHILLRYIQYPNTIAIKQTINKLTPNIVRNMQGAE
jgi:hypothetical protein